MARFSEATIQRLRDAGWYPGRSVDISQIESVVEAAGFVIFPVARDFWREFDGIDITCSDGYMSFDALLVAEIPYAKFKPHIERLNRPLCPIGERYSEVFLIDPDSQVYGMAEGTIGLYSKLADEFIENISKGRNARWEYQKR